MDKRLLQTYSVWAKENLEKQVEVSLKTLGINGEKDIKSAKKVGDYTVIDGDANSYPADLFDKRRSIVTMVTEKGYQNVIEEFAYTWFNRFVALRFMEVHDFLPHGFRVLSNRSGGIEPEILKNLNLVKDELHLDIAVCADLKEQGKTEELYRYVLLRQCNALADILPMLFSRDGDYLELLLPKSLLIGETVITRLVDIPEDNFLNDVEAIGWMYQFYVADKRQEYRDAKTVTKELIPTLTQVFTTDWIVRYMAENSLGRLWMESYPQSSLRSEMKYYVDDSEQTEEVQRKLNAIKYKNVSPEEIRVIEPCCGSGHILAIAFDLLYKMYDEKGYQKRDIPSLILSKNLYGLEIDKRASQLASFSLVMKARTINPRFFSASYYVTPQVHEIYDSHYLESLNYRQCMKETGVFSDDELKAITALVDTFRNGKTVGSLIKVKPLDYAAIESAIAKMEQNVVTTVFNYQFFSEGAALLKKLLVQAKVMTEKYDVMITNPPYLGITKMEAVPKEYLIENYPDSKSDMFAMFMEAPFVKANGFRAIVNPDSWMFLISFEKLRQKILVTASIINMVHLGMGAFDATVQTTAFVLRHSIANYNGSFFRLVDAKDKESTFLDSKPLTATPEKYSAIPSMPIAYWVGKKVSEIYCNNKTIESIADVRHGMSTGKNEWFVRLWHEVDWPKIDTHITDREQIPYSAGKYFPYNKGGDFRRWYGNAENVLWYDVSGQKKMASLSGHRHDGKDQYFHEGITWSFISSSYFGVRYTPTGFAFDVAGSSMFLPHEMVKYVLGVLCSCLGTYFMSIQNPTMNFQVGNLKNIPICISNKEEVDALVDQNIQYSKADWDSFETSWDFAAHPLCGLGEKKQPIQVIYNAWESICRARFSQLKDNEETLNKLFINTYGLQSELTPFISDDEITVRLADKERDIKSLISYLVGIIMGRYSLDVDGLAYAGGNWDASKYRTYQPDDDGIIPIYSKVGMEDGLTARIIELVKLIYGEDTYRQNMDFIAEALGKGNNESSEETLNRYLNDGFYADHLKIYQKRPIYWMFSSGKNSGFKCLIYMHRYTEDTLARINGKYFLPESTRLKNDMEDLLARINSAEGRDRVRLEKERQKLSAAYNEAIEYGQILDHMANKYISIDLDDGVKTNYAKFQGVELVTDSGTKVKKDLLVPIK